MKKRISALVFLLVFLFALPAWASNNWEQTLNIPVKEVWMWGDKQFAVTKGDNSKLYVKEQGKKWDEHLIYDNIEADLRFSFKYCGHALTPDKMYLFALKDGEKVVYTSSDGTRWESSGLTFPDNTIEVVSLGNNELLAVTDRGMMTKSPDGGKSWNNHVGTGEPWDHIAAVGNKAFAVMGGELKVTSDLENWTGTGFKIGRALIERKPKGGTFVSEYLGGTAVPSVDFAEDQTVAAFHPGSLGKVAISTDGGKTLEIVSEDNFRYRDGYIPSRVMALAVSKNVIFAGTPDDYTFFSVDKGKNWDKVRIREEVRDMAIDGNTVLAATPKGVYQLDFEKPEIEQVEQPQEDEQPELDTDQQEKVKISPEPAISKVVKFTLDKNQYMVGGETKQMDTAPMVHEGRTYLPVRYLALSLGVPNQGIKWEAPYITLSKGETTVKLNVKETSMEVNGVAKESDKPLLQEGRTLLPARGIAEAFGYSISWDGETKTMTIQ
ncbi:MAG: copper amine oxidase N-terminal domain-containing protein [Firmicutes bacterium]|nr:copper amine oxidase N-terminal domain-containing protein [Bacillota bacterium]